MEDEEDIKKFILDSEKHMKRRNLNQRRCGGFRVYLYEKYGRKFAVKEVDTSCTVPSQEVDVMKMLHHENIVSLKGAYEVVQNKIHLLLEYCEGGDLERLLEDRASTSAFLSSAQIRTWTLQLASALQYIHSRDVLHLDVHPGNILLTAAGHIKLGDFGNTRTVSSSSRHYAPICLGPDTYPYSTRTDMWGLGYCVFHMATLRPLCMDEIPVVPERYGQHLQHLVESLLQKDQNSRPSADQVLAHPFLTCQTEDDVKQKIYCEGVVQQRDYCEDDVQERDHCEDDVQQGNNECKVAPTWTSTQMR